MNAASAHRPSDGQVVNCGNCGTAFTSYGALWCRDCRTFIPCDHRHEVHGHVIKRDGSKDGRAWCQTCGRTRSTPRSEGIGPICFRDNRDDVPCARCGSTDGVQTHHWAPRAIFGEIEADQWPTSELCTSCHQLWHKLMRQANGYRLAPELRSAS